jgi:DNA-nicking Smr family endonuclease
MAKKKPKKKKQTSPAQPRRLDPGPLEHNPFAALKSVDIPAPVPEPQPPRRPEPTRPTRSAPDDEELFQAAMAEVEPIHPGKGRVTGRPSRRGPTEIIVNEDLEVMARLEDLVSGRAPFDIVDTDEYLEGYVRGIHPLVLDKLRRGLFSVQAHLDLHGLTVVEAEEAVREFITEAMTLRYRCVLLVHGRGLNSKDQIPVLKKRLEKILLRGPTRKKILAFTTARPHDGGGGASYVLLRAKN